MIKDKSIRLNFKCGCFLTVFIGEDTNIKAYLSCCKEHEHPCAKTADFYLSHFSKQIKYPEKQGLSGIDDSLWNDGYRQAISDMKQLNGEDFMEKEKLVFLDEKEVEKIIEDFGMIHIKRNGDMFIRSDIIAKEIVAHFSKPSMDIQKELSNMIIDIQKEIESRPQYPNIGKKGCLKRLQELYDKLPQDKPSVPLELSKEDMEFVCEKVHKAYCLYHKERTGEEYWTKGDYSKLSEEVKEYDRCTVRAVLGAIHNPLGGK